MNEAQPRSQRQSESTPEDEWKSQAETGRKVVIAVIVITLSLSIVVVVAYNLVIGSDRLSLQVSNFLVEAALCAFFYRGERWARWLAGFLYLLGGAVGVVLGLLSTPVGGVMMFAIAAIYAGSGVVLLAAPAVDAYFSARQKRAS